MLSTVMLTFVVPTFGMLTNDSSSGSLGVVVSDP